MLKKITNLSEIAPPTMHNVQKMVLIPIDCWVHNSLVSL